jgi:hypothetical protein
MKEAAKRPLPPVPTKPSRQGRRVIQRFGGIFPAPRGAGPFTGESPKPGKWPSALCDGVHDSIWESTRV